MIGRDREMVVVSATIDGSPSTEPNLVLHGDAGVGKTTLLRAGVLHAEGLGQRVITAAGYDVEVSLAYAGLHQLFAPIMSYLERLPHFQREVLRTAMGLEGG